jgi:hypothetical protein
MRNQNSSLFNQNIYCIHFAIINLLCVDLYDENIHLFIGTDTAVSCPTLLIPASQLNILMQISKQGRSFIIVFFHPEPLKD